MPEEGGSATGTGTETAQPEQVTISKAELEKIKGDASKVTELQESLDELQETLSGSGYLEFLENKGKPKETPKETPKTTPTEPAAPKSAQELDSMSNSQLVGHLFSELDKKLSAHATSVKETVDSVKVETEKTRHETEKAVSVQRMRDRIKEVADAKSEDGTARNPGFWDLKDEIYKISLKYPDIDPQDAYDLVTGRKVKPDYQRLKKADDDRVAEEKRRAGSEHPAQSLPVSAVDTTRKSIESAFDAAWAKHVGAGRDRIG